MNYQAYPKVCLTHKKMFDKRRVLNGGLGGSYVYPACQIPMFFFHPETGEWNECCIKKHIMSFYPFIRDEYACQPMEVLNHNYSWMTLDGRAKLTDNCGTFASCSGPSKVCLTPRRQGATTNPLTEMVKNMLAGGDTRYVCLDVGAPGSKGSAGVVPLPREVFYFGSAPLVLLDVAVAGLCRGDVARRPRDGSPTAGLPSGCSSCWRGEVRRRRRAPLLRSFL